MVRPGCRKVCMMELLVAARRYTDAKRLDIIAVLRKHVGNPLVDEAAYFAKTDSLKRGIEGLTRTIKSRGHGKVSLRCFENELDALSAPSLYVPLGLSKDEGHSSTLGWENRKGGD